MGMKDRLQILLEGCTDLAELNILEMFVAYLEKLLDAEIKVDENSARKLDGREILEGLLVALKLSRDKYKEKLEREHE